MRLKGYFFLKPDGRIIEIPKDFDSKQYEELWESLHKDKDVQGFLVLKEDD